MLIHERDYALHIIMLYIKVLIVVTVSNLLTSFSETSFLLDRISKTSGDWATDLLLRKHVE